MKHILKHLAGGGDEDELNCEHPNFFGPQVTLQDQCHSAMNDCAYQFDFINLFELAFCWMGGHWGVILLLNIIAIQISVFLCFFFIFLDFKFISSVVEEYLAPAIAYISEWLKMPEALAAVTLLALANGAGDVITALVASGSAGGLSYNIGAIYGAGLFVCSIIVALTINNSETDIQLEVNTIWRDVGFYIISTVTVCIFALVGTLTFFSAVIMLCLYVSLVIVVLVQERMKPKEEKESPEAEDEEGQNKGPRELSPEEKAKALASKDLIYIPEDKTEEEQKAFPKKWHAPLNKLNTAVGAKRMKLLMAKFKSTVVLMMKLKQSAKEDTPWDEMGIVDRIFFVIDQPFNYMRKITLPPCEEEKFDKKYATLFPIPGFLFLYFSITMSFVWWQVLIIVTAGLICSLAIHYTLPKDGVPKYFVLLEVYGAVGALVWTYVACGILIDVLQYLGMISKLNKTYLGLTVIAVGNALPDGVTTIALAKQGYAVMGLTGAYAGQLFGLLIGFGLALMKITLAHGPQPFDLFNPALISTNAMNIIVILVSLGNLVISFFYGLTHQYKYSKLLAKSIGGLYVVFILVTTGMAVTQALQS